MSTAEKKVEEIKKSTDIRIIKGLKNIVSDFSVPKFEDDYELLFKEFGDKVAETMKGESTGESTELVEQGKTLTEECAELKKTNEIMVSSLRKIVN